MARPAASCVRATGLLSRRPPRNPPARDSEFIALRTFPDPTAAFRIWLKFDAAAPGKGTVAVKTAPRIRTGYCDPPTTVVPAAKMTVAAAETPMAAAMTTAMATTWPPP